VLEGWLVKQRIPSSTTFLVNWLQLHEMKTAPSRSSSFEAFVSDYWSVSWGTYSIYLKFSSLHSWQGWWRNSIETWTSWDVVSHVWLTIQLLAAMLLTMKSRLIILLANVKAVCIWCGLLWTLIVELVVTALEAASLLFHISMESRHLHLLFHKCWNSYRLCNP
jgi:hypothetical protein